MRQKRQDLGVRVIVLYKGGKAVAEFTLAAALVVVAATGELASLREAASVMQQHVASRWSLLLGQALSTLVSQRGVRLLELGLALDALVSAVEGWTLWRGYRWGAWLVVSATALPLPLEIWAIARDRGAGRLLLAVINVAVVVYLALRIARERRPNLTGVG